mgnify:CR=1 FL=1
MFKDISIKGKILLLSLITIVIVSVAIAVDSIYSIKNFSNKNIENFKNEAYAKKELELKNYVSLAVKTVEAYHNRTSIDKIKVEVQDQLKMQTNFLFSILESEYEKLKGTMSDEALKQRLKSIVDATRYGNTGYFWINDTNSVIVTHPIKPELNGKDMVEYKDKGGKQIFKEFSTVAKNNGGTNYADYFYNVASAVKQVQVTNISGEETDAFKSYFKDLPTVADENNVGTTLAYCFENIVKKANQNGNYVTGVIFRGQICNEDGSSYNNNVYKYKGKFYLSLAEAAANNGKSVTEVEADTENLTTYESGHCYYCSKDIFHHEGSGTMERAIMRNNAYVLKVTGFASIGSAEIVFPTGDEQGEDTDKNFYLKLTSTILPWQVRFNNIEF